MVLWVLSSSYTTVDIAGTPVSAWVDPGSLATIRSIRTTEPRQQSCKKLCRSQSHSAGLNHKAFPNIHSGGSGVQPGESQCQFISDQIKGQLVSLVCWVLMWCYLYMWRSKKFSPTKQKGFRDGLSYYTPQKSEETRGNAITQPQSHPIKKCRS